MLIEIELHMLIEIESMKAEEDVTCKLDKSSIQTQLAISKTAEM